MMADARYWIRRYQEKDALWIHDGNPKRPHALLSSGKHSSGFFNSRLVIPDQDLMGEAAWNLVHLFHHFGGDLSKVQGVVGPQTGATKLAELISRQIFAYTGESCFWASPAKMEVDGKKSMVFSDEELALLPGKSILLCEDVITTGGSVDLTAEAVERAGGMVLPFVLALVNRSGLVEVSGRKIVSLIDRHMPTWEPDECPLCQEGSEALRPKDNWATLNADY
jgi:orotate phosphoribosyltransferase